MRQGEERHPSGIKSRELNPMKKLLIILLLCISSLLSAQQNDNAMRIAVLDFGTSGGLSDMEAITLTNRLRSMLVKTNAFVVLERGKMDEILTEQGFQQTGCTTAECAVEVGKMLNVQKMVSGTIGKLGRTWTMDISLIDVETSQIEKSFFQDYKGEIDALLTEMESVAIQIANIAKKQDKPVQDKKKIFNLEIKSQPSGAKIVINDKNAGTTPFKSNVREGLTLEIKLQKENYEELIRNITVTDDVDINADLEFSQAYKDELAARAGKQITTPELTKETGSSSTWWWIGGGIVVAGGVAAAVLLSDSGNGNGSEEPTPVFPMPPGRP